MIEVFLPYKLKSIANTTENRFVKKARIWNEKKYILFFLGPLIAENPPKFPVEVTLIRLSPRMLDAEDNLPFAFKSIRDSISQLLVPEKPRGHGDNDIRISWKYMQEKAKLPGIKIRIQDYDNERNTT